MALFDFDVFPIIETKRLRLRRITLDDAADWLAVFNHPDVLAYLIDFETDPDESEIRETIQWADDIFERKTGFRWAITLKGDDRMIGSCGYHGGRYRHSAEIGYELHRKHWRKGIMTEALSAMLNYGFDTLDLHRIEADVTDGNVASAGLLKSLGFIHEGTWRDKVIWREAYYDLWQFGLLEDEYRR